MSHPGGAPSRSALLVTALLVADLLVTFGAHVAWLRRGAPGGYQTPADTIALGVLSALPCVLLLAAQGVFLPLARPRVVFLGTVALVSFMTFAGYVSTALHYSLTSPGLLDGIEMLALPIYQFAVVLGGLGIAALLPAGTEGRRTTG